MGDLTNTEALAIGAIGGAAIGVFLAFILIFYILTVIATWKIFTKAGEAGWKALIPIYNVYILCKIIGINFWLYIIGVPLIIGVLSAFINNESISSMFSSLYTIGIEIYIAVKLGKAFNKSTGFIVGLVLLPNIFQLILGFGSSEYKGIK